MHTPSRELIVAAKAIIKVSHLLSEAIVVNAQLLEALEARGCEIDTAAPCGKLNIDPCDTCRAIELAKETG